MSEQGRYFLFFMFRMAMIKLAVVRIIINSSYVLISTTPSARLGIGGMRALSAALAGILYCQGCFLPCDLHGSFPLCFEVFLKTLIDHIHPSIRIQERKRKEKSIWKILIKRVYQIDARLRKHFSVGRIQCAVSLNEGFKHWILFFWQAGYLLKLQ